MVEVPGRLFDPDYSYICQHYLKLKNNERQIRKYQGNAWEECQISA